MAATLDQEDIIDRIAEYEGWEQQGALLMKRYEFDDFAAALDFVNRVGEAAEELQHHPDIMLQNYNEVVLRVTTHDADGLTDKDFSLVDRVEQVAER